ncbi:MAG: PD40 domain-containing protein [Anaerolineae bacterium]|nr:PD40 domain-containing protein [Anaerolineae bacterium]
MTLRRRLLLTISTLILMFSVVLVKITATDERPFIELSRPDRGKVFAIAWSPDGQYIAVGTEQGLWIYTDTFKDVTHAEDAPIHALAWSPDGKTIAAGYFGVQSEREEPDRVTHLIKGGGLRLWSVRGAGIRITLTAGITLLQNGSVYSVRFSDDGSKLALLAENAQLLYSDGIMGRDRVRIYAVNSNNIIYDALTDRTDSIQDNRVTHGTNGLDWNNNQLAIMRKFNEKDRQHFSILVSDGDSFRPQSSYIDSESFWATLTAIGWNDDGTQLAVSAIPSDNPNTSGGINLCDRDESNGAACVYLPVINHGIGIAQSVPTLAWCPRSSLLAYSEGTVIHLWDAATQLPIADLDAAYNTVTMLAWKPDASALLSAGSDYIVRLWTRFDTYQTPDPKPFKSVSLSLLRSQETPSPDGQWIAKVDQSATDTLNVTVSNNQNGRKWTISSQSNVPQHDSVGVSWSPDSTILVTSTSNLANLSCGFPSEEHVQFWSVKTGTLLVDLGQIINLSWRDDGKVAAVGRLAGFRGIMIEVRETSSGKILQTSAPSYEWGADLWANTFDNYFAVSAWSPDGRLVAVSAYIGCGMGGPASVILWDTQQNDIAGELRTYRTSWGGSGNGAGISAWSPNGKLVAVVGFDDFYLYRMDWEGEHLSTRIIWQPTELRNFDWSGSVFSPDSRYFFYASVIIDTNTTWPVFKFRNHGYYDYYRWEGDMLIGVRKSDETTHGAEVYFRTSDFLPQ